MDIQTEYGVFKNLIGDWQLDIGCAISEDLQEYVQIKALEELDKYWKDDSTEYKYFVETYLLSSTFKNYRLSIAVDTITGDIKYNCVLYKGEIDNIEKMNAKLILVSVGYDSKSDRNILYIDDENLIGPDTKIILNGMVSNFTGDTEIRSYKYKKKKYYDDAYFQIGNVEYPMIRAKVSNGEYKIKIDGVDTSEFRYEDSFIDLIISQEICISINHMSAGVRSMLIRKILDIDCKDITELHNHDFEDILYINNKKIITNNGKNNSIDFIGNDMYIYIDNDDYEMSDIKIVDSFKDTIYIVPRHRSINKVEEKKIKRRLFDVIKGGKNNA